MSAEEKDILEKKVDKILSYLHNDDDTGKKGLVADFSDHKNEFREFMIKYEQDQALKKRDLKWASTIFGMIGTFIVYIFKAVIDKFQQHGN